jgi:hypothetical protein
MIIRGSPKNEMQEIVQETSNPKTKINLFPWILKTYQIISE